MTARAIQLGFLAALIGLWYLATHQWGVNPVLLPAPENVWAEFVRIVSTGEFVDDLLVTLYELAVAFSCAAVAGTLAGYLISRSPYLVKMLEPFLAGLYAIPAILFFPLYLLFFGFDTGSKIGIGLTISFFPIVLNTIAGFSSVEKVYVTAAKSMGASHGDMFWRVLLPGAFPVILTGWRMGFIVAFLSILGTETITSFAGLGHRIVEALDAMDTSIMFAYIAFAVIISACLNMFVRFLEATFAKPGVRR